MTDDERRQWMVDPECPWWAKLRRAESLINEIEARFNTLNRAGSGWEIIREPDAEQALVYRIRFPKTISADFAVLVGDAIHNLRSSLDQVAYQLAVQHSGPLTEDTERMTEFPIRASGEQFDGWAASRSRRTKLRRAEIFGEAGLQAIRSVQPFAFAEEAAAITGQSGAEAIGRSQEDERDNDVSFVLNTLWNVDKHRRLPALAWVISLLWWNGTSEQGLTTAHLNEPLVDGQVLARDEGNREVSFEFELVLLDSPAQGSRHLVDTLRNLHQSLAGWVIPRMLHVADGNEPPFIIRFRPPRAPAANASAS
jgi:hypothetical protein